MQLSAYYSKTEALVSLPLRPDSLDRRVGSQAESTTMPLPSIDRSARDASHLQCDPTNAPVSMGTSIIAVTYKGGVILGADSRTSTGTYIANRVADKINALANNVYILRSGSAADTQAIISYVELYIAQHQCEEGEQISVSTAARLATNIAYQNKDMLQAGLIIAGWDKHKGGTVWGVTLGGTMVQAPYATGGSGSTYIYGWMDRFWKEGMSEEEAKAFVIKGLSLAMARDASSGGCIRTVTIDEKGVRRDFLPGNLVPPTYGDLPRP